MYFAHGIREMKQKMKSRGSIHALVTSLSFSLLVYVLATGQTFMVAKNCDPYYYYCLSIQKEIQNHD